MNPFEILILVLLAFFALKCLKMSRHARRERRDEKARESADTSEADAYREQLSRLEERIRVLERIITDDEPGPRQSYRNP